MKPPSYTEQIAVWGRIARNRKRAAMALPGRHHTRAAKELRRRGWLAVDTRIFYLDVELMGLKYGWVGLKEGRAA